MCLSERNSTIEDQCGALLAEAIERLSIHNVPHFVISYMIYICNPKLATLINLPTMSLKQFKSEDHLSHFPEGGINIKVLDQ